jgi:hypothetical protein
MVALLVSTSAVGAQVPTDRGNQGDPPKGFQVAGVAVTRADEKTPSSAALRSAVALQSSLTARQRKAIQSILKENEPALAAAMKQLPALREPTAPSTDAAAIKARVAEDAATLRAMQEGSLRLKAIHDKIDAKVSAVLTVEQRTLYQAAIAPAVAQGSDATKSVAVSPSYNPNYNSTYCSYASQYASYADYYSYFARLYAYYNYYYNTYGSYNAYYYLYYADIYDTQGQYLTSSAFFDEFTLHADPFGRASGARSYEASATNYSYYGNGYAYSNYSTYQYTYAYYAYYYGYLTNQNAYRTYVYVAYC